MAYVNIRDLPDSTHAVLSERAKAAHMSTSAYIKSILIREAAVPTLDEILDRAAARPTGTTTFDDVVRVIREARGD
jgi:antitoxin FitA